MLELLSGWLVCKTKARDERIAFLNYFDNLFSWIIYSFDRLIGMKVQRLIQLRLIYQLELFDLQKKKKKQWNIECDGRIIGCELRVEFLSISLAFNLFGSRIEINSAIWSCHIFNKRKLPFILIFFSAGWILFHQTITNLYC